MRVWALSPSSKYELSSFRVQSRIHRIMGNAPCSGRAGAVARQQGGESASGSADSLANHDKFVILFLAVPDGRGRGVAADVLGYPDADRPATGAAHGSMRALGSNLTDDDGRGAPCRRQRNEFQRRKAGNARFARSTAPVPRRACCHVPPKPRRWRSPVGGICGMLS
jgi:hypothetical protein